MTDTYKESTLVESERGMKYSILDLEIVTTGEGGTSIFYNTS